MLLKKLVLIYHKLKYELNDQMGCQILPLKIFFRFLIKTRLKHSIISFSRLESISLSKVFVIKIFKAQLK